jgi:hypothetical protein
MMIEDEDNSFGLFYLKLKDSYKDTSKIESIKITLLKTAPWTTAQSVASPIKTDNNDDFQKQYL